MNPDIVIERLEEIANLMETVLNHSLIVFDESFRELRKIVKILSADEEFVKLDGLGVLSDDDDPEVDGGKPFDAMVKSLNKEKECDPIGLFDQLHSRIYGLIMALVEYKKYAR